MNKHLSIADFVEACDTRSKAPNGFNMPDSIPIYYWGMAMMGEGGELCNLLAKMERVKAGAVDAGNSLKATDISKEKLAEEIGGMVIYLAILSKRLGIDLEQAMIETFDAKSVKIGYPVTLGERFPVIVYNDEPIAIAIKDCNCPACKKARASYKGGIGVNNIEEY